MLFGLAPAQTEHSDGYCQAGQHRQQDAGGERRKRHGRRGPEGVQLPRAGEAKDCGASAEQDQVAINHRPSRPRHLCGGKAEAGTKNSLPPAESDDDCRREDRDQHERSGGRDGTLHAEEHGHADDELDPGQERGDGLRHRPWHHVQRQDHADEERRVRPELGYRSDHQKQPDDQARHEQYKLQHGLFVESKPQSCPRPGRSKYRVRRKAIGTRRHGGCDGMWLAHARSMTGRKRSSEGPDPSQQADCALDQAQAAWKLGDLATAMRHIEAALDILEGAGLDNRLGNAYKLHAMAFISRDQASLALAAATRALGYPDIGPRDRMYLYATVAMSMHQLVDLPTGGRVMLEQAWPAALKAGDAKTIVDCASRCAGLMLDCACWASGITNVNLLGLETAAPEPAAVYLKRAEEFIQACEIHLDQLEPQDRSWVLCQKAAVIAAITGLRRILVRLHERPRLGRRLAPPGDDDREGHRIDGAQRRAHERGARASLARTRHGVGAERTVTPADRVGAVARVHGARPAHRGDRRNARLRGAAGAQVEAVDRMDHRCRQPAALRRPARSAGRAGCAGRCPGSRRRRAGHGLYRDPSARAAAAHRAGRACLEREQADPAEPLSRSPRRGAQQVHPRTAHAAGRWRVTQRAAAHRRRGRAGRLFQPGQLFARLPAALRPLAVKHAPAGARPGAAAGRVAGGLVPLAAIPVVCLDSRSPTRAATPSASASCCSAMPTPSSTRCSCRACSWPCRAPSTVPRWWQPRSTARPSCLPPGAGSRRACGRRRSGRPASRRRLPPLALHVQGDQLLRLAAQLAPHLCGVEAAPPRHPRHRPAARRFRPAAPRLIRPGGRPSTGRCERSRTRPASGPPGPPGRPGARCRGRSASSCCDCSVRRRPARACYRAAPRSSTR